MSLMITQRGVVNFGEEKIREQPRDPGKRQILWCSCAIIQFSHTSGAVDILLVFLRNNSLRLFLMLRFTS
jgi:hypothetical protein